MGSSTSFQLSPSSEITIGDVKDQAIASGFLELDDTTLKFRHLSFLYYFESSALVKEKGITPEYIYAKYCSGGAWGEVINIYLAQVSDPESWLKELTNYGRKNYKIQTHWARKTLSFVLGHLKLTPAFLPPKRAELAATLIGLRTDIDDQAKSDIVNWLVEAARDALIRWSERGSRMYRLSDLNHSFRTRLFEPDSIFEYAQKSRLRTLCLANHTAADDYLEVCIENGEQFNEFFFRHVTNLICKVFNEVSFHTNIRDLVLFSLQGKYIRFRKFWSLLTENSDNKILSFFINQLEKELPQESYGSDAYVFLTWLHGSPELFNSDEIFELQVKLVEMAYTLPDHLNRGQVWTCLLNMMIEDTFTSAGFMRERYHSPRGVVADSIQLCYPRLEELGCIKSMIKDLEHPNLESHAACFMELVLSFLPTTTYDDAFFRVLRSRLKIPDIDPTEICIILTAFIEKKSKLTREEERMVLILLRHEHPWVVELTGELLYSVGSKRALAFGKEFVERDVFETMKLPAPIWAMLLKDNCNKYHDHLGRRHVAIETLNRIAKKSDQVMEKEDFLFRELAWIGGEETLSFLQKLELNPFKYFTKPRRSVLQKIEAAIKMIEKRLASKTTPPYDPIKALEEEITSISSPERSPEEILRMFIDLAKNRPRKQD